jgi:D-arabinose 1-dehydrogenase-like Zn-dependent alcohol dehydrogenase
VGAPSRRRLAAPLTLSPSVPHMRAVQITKFGGPEVLNVVDLPNPTPGDGEQLFEVSTAGVNFADTHQQGKASITAG